ncbi:MAG TPA: transcription antitermination factor NusB [Pseudobdellovibrionaceae bacterium]|nr:transcription antitermination factor NusB [Pseudobdellovibrionaceae bacterium]
MRRQAREMALQILFQTEFAPQITVQQLLSLYDQTFPSEAVRFCEQLVQGVMSHKQDIDAKIQASSIHWKIERMSSVDRNILRIAAYEICYADEKIKENILINEAIEIAKKFGNTESSGFINGVLDQIARSAQSQ